MKENIARKPAWLREHHNVLNTFNWLQAIWAIQAKRGDLCPAAEHKTG